MSNPNQNLDLTSLSIPEAASLLREDEVTPTDLTQAGLEKIRERNPTLNAFWEVYEEEALQAASRAGKELENGEDKGPLHGIPIAVKDTIDIGGKRTTKGGHPKLQPQMPEEDAFVVKQLKKAGAVIMGKTGLDEWGLGVISQNIHMGSVRNPRDPDRVPGGSSGGSAAAVVSGMALGALGTDAGGSVRIPASFCGCVGLMPTFGLVSVLGATHPDVLFRVGPLSKTVEGGARLLEAISGHNPGDPTSVDKQAEGYLPGSKKEGFTNLRLLTISSFLTDIDSTISDRFLDALAVLEEVGGTVEKQELDISLDRVNESHLSILLTDMLVNREEEVKNYPWCFSEYVRYYLNKGMDYRGIDVAQARIVQREWRKTMEQILDDHTLLALPTLPVPAPRFSEVESAEKHSQLAGKITRSTAPFNLAGVPAITIPLGEVEGLPVGLQLVGAPWNEKFLLKAADAYQQTDGRR